MNYAAANDSPLCSHGKQLTIFHFNDVYNIEPSNIEPVGGAARLMTAYKAIQHRHPMVLFSGDCLNPSMSEYRLFLLFISSMWLFYDVVEAFFYMQWQYLLLYAKFSDLDLTALFLCDTFSCLQT